MFNTKSILRHFSTFLAGTSIALASTSVNAITNIENERPGPPADGWSGQVELGLSGKNGNQDQEEYSGAGKITWHKGDSTAFVLAERAYGKTQGLTDTDETFLHLRGIRELEDHFAVEGFVQWQQNAFDNLASRSLLGGGGRYDIIHQPEVVTLSLGLGAFREREELDLGTFDQVSWAWRANSYASYRHQLNSQVRLLGTFYYQPNLSDTDDFRVLTEVGMSVAISGSLSLKLSYSLSHNSDPAVNLEATPPINKAETNTGYTTSLVYSF